MLCPTCNTPVASSDVECPSCKRQVRTSPAELDDSDLDGVGDGVALATRVDADMAPGQSFMSWFTGLFSWGHGSGESADHGSGDEGSSGGDTSSVWGDGGGDSGDAGGGDGGGGGGD